MSDDHRGLWGYSKEGVLKACDEVCGCKKNSKCNVHTWWWNSGANDGMQKEKEAYKEIMNNHTEVTQNEYRRLKKSAKKAIARDMKDEAVRKSNELGRNHNYVFRLVRKMRMECTDIVGGRCMRENDGTLYFYEKRKNFISAYVRNNE